MHVNRIILFIINYRRFLMDMEITKQDYLKRYKEELLINEMCIRDRCTDVAGGIRTEAECGI